MSETAKPHPKVLKWLGPERAIVRGSTREYMVDLKGHYCVCQGFKSAERAARKDQKSRFDVTCRHLTEAQAEYDAEMLFGDGRLFEAQATVSDPYDEDPFGPEWEARVAKMSGQAVADR